MIYLDNAATSWPKPESVYAAVVETMRERGGNPGRSGHRLSLRAGESIRETRRLLARLFGAPDPERIVLAANATAALNLAIKGLLEAGDHAIASSMEHNAVARPLEALRARGVEVTKVPTSPERGLDPADVARAIAKNTKLVVVAHASNVSGTINPIADIGRLCRERGIAFLVDAAQTAGSVPINVETMNIDLLAFPGHKGLLGPQGTGGLCVGADVDLEPLLEGGTGSSSESLEMPERLPDRFESGTPNTPGIAGLGAGLGFVLGEGVEKIGGRERALTERLLDGLRGIEGVEVYGPSGRGDRSSVVSLNVSGADPIDVASILDQSFEIAARAGLHCAPDAHRALGTIASGALRLSPGYFTTEAEIDRCVEAVGAIAREFAAERTGR